MRKETIRDRIEQNYFTHYGSRSGVLFCGSLPRQDGRFYDYSPNRNHGTITGATWTRENNGHWTLTYDGIANKVDTGSDYIGTSACTLLATIKLTGWGGGNAGRIMDNGKLIFAVNLVTQQLYFYSEASTAAKSADNSIALSTKYRVAVTRTAAGVANFYINGVLSGAADQASGAPAGGTANVCIGNRIAGDRGLAGNIGDLLIYNSVLSAAEILADYQDNK